MGTVSLWMDTESAPVYSSLNADISADVCVIGGGIAGLTAAYFLSKAGSKVVVVDAGGGETQRTTAHLTSALDDRFATLERYHGAEGARLAARSHAFAIDLIERLIQEEEIDCRFERVSGYLHAATADDRQLLQAEFEAVRRAGLDVAHVEASTGHDDAALCFPNQAQLNPLRYLKGLSNAIDRDGGRIYRARVSELTDNDGWRARTTSGFNIRSEQVVVATNAPIHDPFAIHAKQVAHRTYVIGAVVPKGRFPHTLFWDTAKPYHYVRVAETANSEYEVLLVGGEDHRAGSADEGGDRFARLEVWARAHFSGLGEVRWRWSGQVMEPYDSLGFVGRDLVQNVGAYIVTGDSGNGMTHGTLGGRMVADQILGAAVEWESLYDPQRKSQETLRRVARQGLPIARQYGSHLSPGDVATRFDIAPATGAIVWDRFSKRAVYRDAEGIFHERSAYCTHSGCVVQWNATERSWDCPCHGSRFAIDGSVLNGPATDALHDIETASNADEGTVRYVTPSLFVLDGAAASASKLAD